AAGQNRITGASGGVGFESLTISSIPSLILDLSKNDGASGSDDSVTINSSGLLATGLTQLSLNAGTGNNTFNIQGGTAKLDPSLGALGASNLTINASGTAVLQTGRNHGAWNGAGIRSTTAGSANPRVTTLAGIVNDRGNGTTVLSQLDGQSVDANTVLIKYTYNGDSDLNGLITADDYAQI